MGLTLFVCSVIILNLLGCLTTIGAAQDVPPAGVTGQSQGVVQTSPSITTAVHHDLSLPLLLLQPAPPKLTREVHSVMPLPLSSTSVGPDPVVQSTDLRVLAPVPNMSFSGVGEGFVGPAGTYNINAAPPDTDGAVGPNHYLQIVNTDLAIFNKTGTPIYGPVPINTLWSGFGGGCQSNNDGDPIVLYDSIANRWVISQFSVSTLPYLQCVAVSQTADPTGAYFRYSFNYGSVDFPDYPKMSVWPDAYYQTYNIFTNGVTFAGSKVCAFNRAKMLIGAAATQQCFSASSGGLLASDLDGHTLPPAGSPNFVLGLGGTNTTLAAWKFHVDWTTPANSTFTGPTKITVAQYSTYYCSQSRSACIPQSGSGASPLETISDRLMHRIAYRNLGTHEAWVVTHSVALGSGASQSGGVRWYELRPSAGNLTVFQQGTYAPDSNYRWLGSGAMDKYGNIALGFSVSSLTLHPQIHYTGRLVADPLGIMGQGEGIFINGGGSQTGGLDRWGDYSSMSVDPADDCTFWYTNEYLTASGSFNWHTRIGSFKFPGCTSTVSNDFSISANPISLSLAPAKSGTVAISTALVSGVSQTVTLTVSGAPSGATASLSPISVTSGGISTLTVNSGTAAPGNYTLTIKGTAPSGTHSTTVALKVTSTVSNDFSISANPTSLSLAPAKSGTVAISTALVSGVSQTITLTLSGAPSGATASLSPTSVASGGISTLTVNSGTAAPGNYTLTIKGTATSGTHSTSVALKVTSTVIVNGGFETGNLTGWRIDGIAAALAGGHTGSYAARLGGTTATKTTVMTQTFTVPAAGGTLSFFYNVHCPDTVTNDWATVTLTNNSSGGVTTVLGKTCTNTNTWVNKMLSLAGFAGKSVTLNLINRDDNVAANPTYTLYDDVVVQ